MLRAVESCPVVVATRLCRLLARVLQSHRAVPIMCARSPAHHCILLDGRHGSEVVLQGWVRRHVVVLLSNGLAVGVWAAMTRVAREGVGAASAIHQVRRHALLHLLLHRRLLVKLV